MSLNITRLQRQTMLFILFLPSVNHDVKHNEQKCSDEQAENYNIELFVERPATRKINNEDQTLSEMFGCKSTKIFCQSLCAQVAAVCVL